MQVLSNEMVYAGHRNDNCHNAFTDLKKYFGYYYIAFRSGNSHLSSNSQVKVMRSKDAITWEELKFPKINGDVRDCKFYHLGKELMLFIPYRKCNLSTLFKWKYGTLQSIFNPRTLEWSKPQEFRKNWISWRPKTINGKRCVPMFWHGSNSDMTNFNKWKVGLLSNGNVDILYEGDGANEMEIFEYEKTTYAILRRETMDAVLLCVDTKKVMMELPGTFHSPVVYPLEKGKFLIAAREAVMKTTFEDVIEDRLYGSQHEYIVLWELDARKKTIKKVCDLVGGRGKDCGYCGIEKKGDNLLISYYVGNHVVSDIYIAEIEL